MLSERSDRKTLLENKRCECLCAACSAKRSKEKELPSILENLSRFLSAALFLRINEWKDLAVFARKPRQNLLVRQINAAKSFASYGSEKSICWEVLQIHGQTIRIWCLLGAAASVAPFLLYAGVEP